MVEVDTVLNHAEREGAQEAEIISETSRFKYVRCTRGGPDQAISGETTKYALRAVVNGAVGFAYFTGDEEDAVKGAISLARSKEKEEKRRSFIPDRPAPHLNLHRKSVDDTSIEEVISDIKSMSTVTEHKKIVASTMGCQLVSSDIEVANTSGVHRRESRSLSSLWVTCRAADTDYGLGYSYNYSLNYDFDFYDLGENTREMALSQLGKEKIESGKKMVILAPRVFANLLVTAVLPSFLGHNVARGRTTLHLDKEIASDHLMITENPLVHKPQGRSFDDEGAPSQVVTLINDKCVQNFLYDNNHGETTGSGIRFAQYHGRTLRYGPRPCATSVSVTGETVSLDALISEVSDGILVLDETNSHLSKQQTGHFSIAVTSGFIIRNGEITSPVSRCMISGKAFEDLLPHVMLLSFGRELHRSSVYPTYVETGCALVDSLRITV